jgi:putative toxin-antitoxin system antitoxin component (TIGR02293 family)
MKSNPFHPSSKTTTTQYDKILAHAAAVFGTRAQAEEWLARPCSRLNNRVPSEIIGDAIGLQTVEQYLERIKFGVYQ